MLSISNAGLLIIVFIVAGLAALWALEISRATRQAAAELEKMNEKLEEIMERLEDFEEPPPEGEGPSTRPGS